MVKRSVVNEFISRKNKSSRLQNMVLRHAKYKNQSKILNNLNKKKGDNTH